jgi:chromosome segregation ATPase
LKEAEIVITQKYDIFKKLEDERNAAIRYQNLQKQLLTLKASLAHKKVQTYGEKITKLEEDFNKKSEQNEKIQQEITTLEEDLDKCEAEVR